MNTKIAERVRRHVQEQFLNFTARPQGPPRRIVSLVPSQTELLHYLGLEEEVTGITKFCVHPNEWFRNKTRVGGTKKVHIDKVRQLQPDLILANKEENVKEQVEELANTCAVYVSDVNCLADACTMIEYTGYLTSRMEKAAELVAEIGRRFERLPLAGRPIPAAYLIWQQPFMTVGHDTFIHDMMQYCGLQNVFGHLGRYPEVSLEDIRHSGCRFLLLSSEPFPFAGKHAAAIQEQLPDIKVILVDGEMYSWYGSRLLLAAEYFERLSGEVFLKEVS